MNHRNPSDRGSDIRVTLRLAGIEVAVTVEVPEDLDGPAVEASVDPSSSSHSALWSWNLVPVMVAFW